MKQDFSLFVAKSSCIILHVNSGDETWLMWLFAFMQGAEGHNNFCCWLHWRTVQK
jgi:hypothetical protein